MKVTTKKLPIVSVIFIFAGVGTLLLAAHKREHLSGIDPMKDLVFTYRVMGRTGALLILAGVLVLVFIAVRSMVYKIKLD